jgi:hypothetical protein
MDHGAIIVRSLVTILATLIGGFITYRIALSKLQSQRELTIQDWYSKSLLLADQAGRIEPEDYGEEKQRKITKSKATSLSNEIDQHIGEAPGPVEKEVTQALDALAKDCYLLMELEPKDTTAFRNAVDNVTSDADFLKEKINEARESFEEVV